MLVTHEEDIAAYARRDDPLPRRPHRKRRARGGVHDLLNALLLALREIRRNVLRAILTTLGIVIGVGAVITLVTLGNGASAQVRADIASMGSNLLTLHAGATRRPRRCLEQRQAIPASGCRCDRRVKWTR